MALNVLNFSSPIRVGSLSADPASPVNGLIYYNTSDGKFRKYEAGSWTDLAAGASPEFSDATFRIQDNGDATKQIAFQASGISGSTTRTVTMPDSDVDLGLVSSAIQSSEKGAASGVATLDGDSLIPITQIPPAALERLVVVADQTARYALTTATVQTGDTVKQTDTGEMWFVTDDANLDSSAGYAVYTAGSASSVAWSGVTGTPTTLSGYGITDYAAAAKAAAVADAIADSVTDVAPSQNAVFDALALKANDNIVVKTVNSVSPTAGAVVLTTTNIAQGTNLYFTTAAAKAAAVADAIVDGVTDVAPSQNAVYDALALKLASVSQDTTPQLGGNLDLNGKSLDGLLHRAAVASPTSFIEQEYIHATTLTASTTAVASAFTFAFASFEGLEITYKIKEATTGAVRIGTLRVVTDGTDTSLADAYTETADVGVTWAAAINGSNVELSYTSTANAKTMRSDIKRIKA